MKQLILFATISAFLFGCSCNCPKKIEKEFGYELEVTYLDGTLDTFDLVEIDRDTVYPYLHEGCVSLSKTNKRVTVACGVRKFEVIGYYSEKINQNK